ncbi:MAG: NrsF family protein [Acetobacteraceae bacterium]
MTKTDDLIETLAAQARPVRRLPSPWVRLCLWLLAALAVVGALALWHGARPGLGTLLAQPRFALGVAASALTAVLAALAAFLASLPDRARGWVLLPLPAAALWVTTIGYSCLAQWVSPDGSSPPGETLRCASTLLASSIPLSLLTLWMLRHTARLWRRGPVLLGGLAVAAVTATALSLLHPLDASAEILFWNLGVAALVLAVDGVVGPRLVQRLEQA